MIKTDDNKPQGFFAGFVTYMSMLLSCKKYSAGAPMLYQFDRHANKNDDASNLEAGMRESLLRPN